MEQLSGHSTMVANKMNFFLLRLKVQNILCFVFSDQHKEFFYLKEVPIVLFLLQKAKII